MSATDPTLIADDRYRRLVGYLRHSLPAGAAVADLDELLAARLATAEAEKEALRAGLSETDNHWRHDLARAEAAEAALAGLVAKIEAMAAQTLAVGRVVGNDLVGRRWIAAKLRDLLDTDHAAALRAREAKVLRDAADDLGALWVKHGKHPGLPGCYSIGHENWLRNRADSIEKGD